VDDLIQEVSRGRFEVFIRRYVINLGHTPFGAEEQLETLICLKLNEGTITDWKDGLSCQASDQALSEAAATIPETWAYLDAKNLSGGQPLESFAQRIICTLQRIQASHCQNLVDDSDFIVTLIKN